ncbi:uncharacterized protein LOC111592712 [Drosophila hydei]|uniref:Uncharacterized protein LOC111592712 n=1 Tax=Drosophila hydei TaxID=7224 RepID=A0A6J1LC73_DROHY|nr:uncharacterized protein LOC111592712 [Drosophila hydei]
MLAKRTRDADDKIMRKKNSRLRFKKLVLAILLNKQWLDDSEEQGIVMNAKKNVALLIRQKRKTGLLTVAEKTLLRTPHTLRTIEERKKLCLVVAALPCFANLPPKLRVRLIPYLKFATYGEDRVLIRQNDVPITVYFMISGEIEMKKVVYDKTTKKMVMVSEAIVGGGDVIGDVAMLESCLRLNTYVTLNPCEVLYITDDEFKDVLGKFMRKQWQQKKAALSSVEHFNFFTEAQIVRACAYCQLEQYDPLHSIYSEDRGAVSCVHFILSGECVVLQCLKMFQVIKPDGTKTYELVTVKESENDIFANPTRSVKSLSSSFHDVGQTRDKLLSGSKFNLSELLASSSDMDDETVEQKKAKRITGLREIEIACGFGLSNEPVVGRDRKKSHALSKRLTTSKSKRSLLVQSEKVTSEEHISTFSSTTDESYLDEEFELFETQTDSLEHRSSSKLSESSSPAESMDRNSDKSSRVVTVYNTDYVDTSGDEAAESLSAQSSVYCANYEKEKGPLINKPSETHFIDVGSLTYGGIFGLGEKITHRVIMARTVVQCLLLPRYWLMAEAQNPGHIWLRRKFSLETNIPSREELFSHFLKTRRWEKFKRDYVQSTLNENSVNSTQPEDIPILCRIVETRDNI